MKIDGRRVAGFLRDSGACRVVLLHGEDAGLIRERADTLIRSVAGSVTDPFRVADLGPGAGERMAEEAASLSLTGGRRAVRVRDATDALTEPVRSVLAGGGEALIVLEAATLTARSRLRALVEGAPNAAAIACYPEEGQTLEATIGTALGEAGVSAAPEALSWLATQLGGDRAGIRREVEKLALYAGPGGAVDVQAARLLAPDQAALSLEDALFAAFAGDAPAALRAFEGALADGATPVGVLRAALLHVQRLHRIRLAMPRGGREADAVRAARPPVFFRRVPAMVAALERWPAAALAALLGRLLAAEYACKQSAAPAEAICRALLLDVARTGGADRLAAAGL
ncbi:MAG: DNA polymerase III subunit delta [Acetobacteraceae bacterium]|nr:DNA polymerase III subunit delta [Acetobacteraceae bacterium]